jgi:hypothetical protein
MFFASVPVDTKQMRYCSLIRMERWPLRSPELHRAYYTVKRYNSSSGIAKLAKYPHSAVLAIVKRAVPAAAKKLS